MADTSFGFRYTYYYYRPFYFHYSRSLHTSIFFLSHLHLFPFTPPSFPIHTSIFFPSHLIIFSPYCSRPRWTLHSRPGPSTTLETFHTTVPRRPFRAPFVQPLLTHDMKLANPSTGSAPATACCGGGWRPPCQRASAYPPPANLRDACPLALLCLSTRKLALRRVTLSRDLV